MKSRNPITVALSVATVGLALALPAQVALAQDSAQKVMPDSARAADSQIVTAATDARPLSMRMTRTGSNIVRYRTDESLPISEYDRTYIDRTGASTTAEMLRTIPQIQVGR